jgi:spermidine synthase
VSGARAARRRRIGTPAPVQATTPFALAEVIAEPGRPRVRTLLLDGREAGRVDLDDPRGLGFAYLRRMADALDAMRPPSHGLDVLHIGGGAFALPRYVAASRPASRQVVMEIDPEVVRLAREHLGLRTGPRLRVQTGDAAALITARPDRSADAIVGDAFLGPDIPAALTGPAFAGQVRRVLRPAGLYLLNVIDVPPPEAARAARRVLAAAFPHVAAVAPPGVLRGRAPGNLVLLASGVPLPLSALARAARHALPREQVREGGF